MGVRPALEQVPAKAIIRKVSLYGKGDLHHSDTRALDVGHWILQEDEWPDQQAAPVLSIQECAARVTQAIGWGATDGAPPSSAPNLSFETADSNG